MRMNNCVFDADLVKTLPPNLKADENILALANIIKEQLQLNCALAKSCIIYARIDELGHDLLDVIAQDLNVKWYRNEYPVEVKRGLIKDSVKVHKKLGTKYAVETAIGKLHPNSYVEEWDEYGGEPFSFRVVVDTTFSKIGAGYKEISDAVSFSKRKSAHLEDVIFQCIYGIEVSVDSLNNEVDFKRCGTFRCGG